MRWSVSVDEGIADAVIAVFSNSSSHARERLSAFSQRDWERTHPWLIASGMTLYFLDRLQSLNIENALPTATIAAFRQNLADNRKRHDSMMAEFIAINQAFTRAGVLYANAKGFTLSPGYCPDPTLRSQLDFDFLVHEKDLEPCRDILTLMGYVQSVATASAWEFKSRSSAVIRTEDHYKPSPQRRVELHFARSGSPRNAMANAQLSRTALRAWQGHSFPVFAPEDQFLIQTLHILSHLRSPCTRLSWLLEYSRFVSSHEHDWALWESVHKRAQATREAYVAIGLSTLLSRQLFGGRVSPQLNEWTLDRLPPNVKLWAQCYGRSACLSRFPGTKLYLLLDAELARGDSEWSTKRRKRLLPLRKVPQMACPEPNEDLLKRVRRLFFQARFTIFRLRFHLVEDLRYLIELQRWKRLLAAQGRSTVLAAAQKRI